MADIAQLVRALVCGTKCRRFESGYPPHHKKAPQRGVFLWCLGGSGENRRFGTSVGKNEFHEVRALRSERGP